MLILEGEKDVDRARKMGFTATCWRGGAGNAAKVTLDELEPLAGRDVILVPDNDEPGREAMRIIGAKLLGVLP